MKLKVCGMKYNPVEVMALRPDYLGFIFWDGTPRNFTLPKLPELPTGVQAVGVFVDESIPTLVKRIKSYGLHGVQLHGKESPEYCRELREHLRKESLEVFIIKAFGVGPDFDFESLKDYEDLCDFFLFDARGPQPGGNGTVFNWELLSNYTCSIPYFLSGGIGEKDCAGLESFSRTPQATHCVAIDVNSKFELRPGEKDTQALKRFIQCGIWSGNNQNSLLN